MPLHKIGNLARHARKKRLKLTGLVHEQEALSEDAHPGARLCEETWDSRPSPSRAAGRRRLCRADPKPDRDRHVISYGIHTFATEARFWAWASCKPIHEMKENYAQHRCLGQGIADGGLSIRHVPGPSSWRCRQWRGLRPVAILSGGFVLKSYMFMRCYRV